MKKINKDYIDSNKRTEKLAQWLLSLNVEEEKDYAAEYNLQDGAVAKKQVENNVVSETKTNIVEEKVEISVDEIRNKLYKALNGKGAFSRFKKEIAYLGIREKWFLFRDERLKEKVKQWLEDNEIEYIEEK